MSDVVYDLQKAAKIIKNHFPVQAAICARAAQHIIELQRKYDASVDWHAEDTSNNWSYDDIEKNIQARAKLK